MPCFDMYFSAWCQAVCQNMLPVQSAVAQFTSYLTMPIHPYLHGGARTGQSHIKARGQRKQEAWSCSAHSLGQSYSVPCQVGCLALDPDVLWALARWLQAVPFHPRPSRSLPNPNTCLVNHPLAANTLFPCNHIAACQESTGTCGQVPAVKKNFFQ